MKKRKVPMVCLNFEIEGEINQICFEPENLRNWLKGLKIKQGQEKVELQFNYNGKEYIRKIDVKNELPSIKCAVKYAEIMKGIVPKSLSIYLEDLTQKLCEKPIVPIVKREHELEKIWFYISQKVRNNVFITGEIDVGKTAIAHEIARQISTNECPKEFYEKRVLFLNP